MHELECDEIDEYVSGHKAAVGFMPRWGIQFRRQFQTRWGISDMNGLENSELCLTSDRDGRRASIVCLHRQRLIYRLCVAPKTECKDNYHTAWKQGLPPVVCGVHIHGWPENRDYVCSAGFGELPVRRPLSGVVGLIDALHWVVSDLGIQMDPGQRDIDLPPYELV